MNSNASAARDLQRRKPFARRWLQRYRGMVRVSVYCACVCTGVAAVAARSALGAAAEASLAMSRQFEGLSDVVGPGHAIDLNGQRVYVASSTTTANPNDVLDRFAQLCRERPSAFARAAAEGITDGSSESARSAGIGVVRQDDKHDGVLGCFLGSSVARLGMPASELFREVVRTQDIGVLGDFVLVYARAMGDGRTHIVTTSTRGSFKVLAMFPAAGDAPGSDSSISARPRAARRLLSGTTGQAPYAVRIYESTDSLTTMFDGLDVDMTARGWSRLHDQGLPEGTHLYFHTSGAHLLATAQRTHAHTVVSMAEMGAGDPAAVGLSVR